LPEPSRKNPEHQVHLYRNEWMLEKLKAKALAGELARRAKANPKYSLRAFARDMGGSQSLLSQMFAGGRAMTEEFNRNLLRDFKLSQKDRDILAMGLPSDTTREPSKISLEQFAVISDWVHFAVLSLLDVTDLQYNAAWIAKRLNISEKKAKSA